ncbi:MAG: hypothetical protein R3217_04195 [Gammaproteobacteria bacterium]|nr:hypothetical protein [Gammaproteobacteria bacterium]
MRNYLSLAFLLLAGQAQAMPTNAAIAVMFGETETVSASAMPETENHDRRLDFRYRTRDTYYTLIGLFDREESLSRGTTFDAASVATYTGPAYTFDYIDESAIQQRGYELIFMQYWPTSSGLEVHAGFGAARLANTIDYTAVLFDETDTSLTTTSLRQEELKETSGIAALAFRGRWNYIGMHVEARYYHKVPVADPFAAELDTDQTWLSAGLDFWFGESLALGLRYMDDEVFESLGATLTWSY